MFGMNLAVVDLLLPAVASLSPTWTPICCFGVGAGPWVWRGMLVRGAALAKCRLCLADARPPDPAVSPPVLLPRSSWPSGGRRSSLQRCCLRRMTPRRPRRLHPRPAAPQPTASPHPPSRRCKRRPASWRRCGGCPPRPGLFDVWGACAPPPCGQCGGRVAPPSSTASNPSGLLPARLQRERPSACPLCTAGTQTWCSSSGCASRRLRW